MATPKYVETDVKLSDLVLDASNPRFAQLYSGNSQDDIIRYLLEEEDAMDLVRKIVNMGFFRPDKRLWVLKQPNGKYLVKDGNRRCAAVKALQNPSKYGLSRSMKIDKLPVIIYEDAKLLESMIREEHTTPSVKEWSAIAKALEVHRLAQNHASKEVMMSIDSDISRFLKIANFYNQAVKICGDRLNELLRNSGKKGRKLTIFERLFQSSESCGYKFGNIRSNNAILIHDEALFKKYVNTIVKYLQKNPDTTYHVVDKEKDQKAFLLRLGILEAPTADEASSTTTDAAPSTTSAGRSAKPRKFIIPTNRTENLFPVLNVLRTIPDSLKKVLQEGQRICFNSNKDNGYPNASVSLLRIAFESTLDFILKDTLVNGNSLSRRNSFNDDRLSYRKKALANIVKSTSVRRKLEHFKLEFANLIIHDNWTPTNKEILEYAFRVEELINWMLQEKSVFENDLDLSKV